MSYWQGELSLQPAASIVARHASDQYLNRREGLILEAAAAAVAKLKSLPPRQAEGFAASFKKGTDKLTIAQDKLTKSRQLMPAKLPSPLKQFVLREFPTSRKRAMTSREAAEEQERDEARRRRRAAIQA